MDDVKLIVEEVEPGTAVHNVVRGCFVHSTANGGPQQLIINCGDYLQLWELVDGLLAQQQAFYLFERVEHMDLVPATLRLFGPDSPDAVLLFTFDGRCSLFKLEPQAHHLRDHQQQPAGPMSPPLSAPSSAGPFVLTEVACLALPIPEMRDGLMPKRLGGVCSSGVAPVAKWTALASSVRGVVIAAVHTGLLHVITLHTVTGTAGGATGSTLAAGAAAGASGTKPGGATTSTTGGGGGWGAGGGGGAGDGEPLMMCAAVPIQDTPLYGRTPGMDPLCVMQFMTHVYDMCFVPPPERDALEPPLLVVLHKHERSGGISFQIDCLALMLQMPPRTGGGGGRGGGAGGGSGGAGPSSAGGSKGAEATAAAGLGAVFRATLNPGPWVARMVHPTTTVLLPFSGVPAAGLPAGVLAISSRGVSLYGRPPTLGAIALAAATAEQRAAADADADAGGSTVVEELSSLDPTDDAAVAAFFDKWFGRDAFEDAAIEFAESGGSGGDGGDDDGGGTAAARRYELVSYALAGMPVAAEVLAPGVVLIADSAAGLHLLHAAGKQPWVARVLPDMPNHPNQQLPVFAAPATVTQSIAYLPPPPPPTALGPSMKAEQGDAAAAAAESGLLFLGSNCSSSQILYVPAAHVAADAEPPPPPSSALPTPAPPPMPSGGAAGGKGNGQQRRHQRQPQAGQSDGMAADDGGDGDYEDDDDEEGEEGVSSLLPQLSWPVAELVAIKSLAPVTDVAVVPDSSGASDPWLIASCGRNAAGRLVRARLAAGLVPYMADGPRVPDGCRMFPLRLGTHLGAPGGPTGGGGDGGGHTHIAFSFEAAGRTDLLSVGGGGGGGGGGGEFTQVELPGLTHGSASLLVADVAGQRLVQVTQSGVRALQPLPAGAGLAAKWRPRGGEPLSLAAASPGGGGSLLAVASRTRLSLLRIEPATGAVTELSAVGSLSAQLSALALWRPGGAGGGAGEGPLSAATEAASTFVLMGYWLSNRVEVAAAVEPGRSLLSLQLAEDETPRSLAVLELPYGGYGGGGGAATAAASAARPPVLLAGTHSGQLLMWQLAEPPLTAPSPRPWRLGPCYGVRVSHVAVEMQPGSCTGPGHGGGGGGGAGGGSYVYLHSHSGALVRPRPQAAAAAPAAPAAASPPQPPPLDQLVEVVRVHGSEGLQAVSHVSTEAMPGSCAWVTREGRLLFGRIDPRVRLRWSTAFVGETITSFAYHAASHCLVALCETRPSGAHALRVIDVDSLRQVLSLRLAPGHCHTALTVGPLPCTTGRKAAAAAAAATLRAAAGGGGSAAATAAAAAAAAASEKEFVVLSSYISVDSSADPEVGRHARGGQLLYAALSFLELVAAPSPDGTNATSYSLLLQGTCLVPSVPTALAIARPVPYNSGASNGAATAGSRGEGEGGGGGDPASAAATAVDPVNMPYLMAGCQGGVYLFAVHVDDGRQYGARAVQRALQLVGQVDELNLPLPKGAAEVAAALAAVEKQIRRRAAAEAAAAAAGPSGSGAGGGDAMGGKDEAGGGGGGTEEEEELAEDESELPDVGEVDWDAQLRALAEQEAEEGDAEWRYGLGLLEQPEPEDEEHFRQWWRQQVGGGGGGDGEAGQMPEPTEAARAVKLLRRRFEREAMLGGNDDGNGNGAVGWDSDRDDDDDDDDRDGAGGGGSRRRRAAAGPSLRQLLRDLERDWSQHVTLRPVDAARTFGGACVTSLTAIAACGASAAPSSASAAAAWGAAARGGGGGGGLVLAGDFLGSVTVLRLAANRRGAALVACSPDRHPLYAQAAAWLDPERVLVSVHPHGLAVLRRDPGAEEEAMAAAQRQAVADWEAGRNRQQRSAAEQVWGEEGAAARLPAAARAPAAAAGGGGGAAAAAAGTYGRAAAGAAPSAAASAAGAGPGAAPGASAGGRFLCEDLQSLKAPLREMPGLVLEAGCRVRHMVTRMCRVRLGLRVRPHLHLAAAEGPQLPPSPSPSATAGPSTAPSSSPAAAAAAGRSGSGPPHVPPLPPQQQPAQDDLLLCFSASGHVAAVRVQAAALAPPATSQQPSRLPAPPPPPPPPAPPLAKLARLQHAFNSLDASDAALLTGVDSDSYCHDLSWPLVLPRETAAGAGLAGVGASDVADEAGRRRGAPPVPAPALAAAAAGGEDDEEMLSLEAEAEALAAGCVDGAVMRLLLAAAEAQLRRDSGGGADGGGGAGGSGSSSRVAALLRRLAREVTGAADVAALVGLLQRSSLTGIS